jgi:mono/diheme cytochrome c family protein
MKTIRSTWLALVMANLIGAVPGTAYAQGTGNVAEGALEYGATCGRCHALRSPVERSDRDWVVIVNHMRARTGLTEGQVSDILAFLQATNHVEEPTMERVQGPVIRPPTPEFGPLGRAIEVTTDPSTIDAGRELISEKGCFGCHMIGSEGSRIGPTLNGLVAAEGPSFVAQKLENPAFNDSGTLMPDPRLTGEQIRALIAYLATLR